jgi:excisionase family DNA binding protein
MDPHEEIRSAIADAFQTFAVTGSAFGVVRVFSGRPFPQRGYGGAWAGEVRWGRLTHGRIQDLLSNPSYAGAYVFGRFRSQRWIDADGTIRTKTIELPREEWAVLIHDHHATYISWETYLSIQQRLAANCTHRGARPPREGAALLQGIVHCGGCGHKLSTRYSSNRAYYECSISRSNSSSTPACRSTSATLIDAAVSGRVLEVVSPDQIALALAAADEVTDRRARASRALELQVERARYEAARAERAFHACEPENRLVARSLEQRWEAKLAALAEAEAATVVAKAERAPLPGKSELERLATDLPRLWNAPTTSARDRKRMLRALIADVTLTSEPADIGDQVRIGIRWSSGAAEEIVGNRPGVAHSATPAEAVELIRELAGHSDEEVAARLVAQGLRTGSGHAFDVTAVRWVRHVHRIPSAHADQASGELTIPQVAARLGVGESVIHRWISHGRLTSRRTASGRHRVAFSAAVEQHCRQLIANSQRIRARTPGTLAGGAV